MHSCSQLFCCVKCWSPACLIFHPVTTAPSLLLHGPETQVLAACNALLQCSKWLRGSSHSALLTSLIFLQTAMHSSWFIAGGQFTGAALNPARVLGPAIVFHCYWNTAFIYVFGELFGGLIAAMVVLPLYGFGQFGSLLDTRVCNALGIKIPEKHQHRCAIPCLCSPLCHQYCRLYSARVLPLSMLSSATVGVMLEHLADGD